MHLRRVDTPAPSFDDQDDEDCTFQPAVGYNEATLGLSRRYSVNLWESEEERVERLAFVDRQRKETQVRVRPERQLQMLAKMPRSALGTRRSFLSEEGG